MRTPLPDLNAGAEPPVTEEGSLPPPRPNRRFLAGLILGSLGLALFATVQIDTYWASICWRCSSRRRRP